MDIVTQLIRPRRAQRPDRRRRRGARPRRGGPRGRASRVREIADLDGLEAVYRLYDGIWRPDPKNPPVTTALLRALTKAGNYVAGAFDGDRSASAPASGSSAPPARRGAAQPHRRGRARRRCGRSVGFALKLHQRAWALRARGHRDRVDLRPAGRRNAYFNLVKLGAAPAEYLPNFYGGMADTINGGDDTDRLLARWVAATRRTVVAAQRSAGRRPATPSGSSPPARSWRWPADGRRARGRAAGRRRRCWSPCRATSRPCAPPTRRSRQQWRVAVRDALARLADGGRVAGFDRAGWYVVDRPQKRMTASMKLTGVELRRIQMPLVAPFRTSFGTRDRARRAAGPRGHRRTPRAGASASPCPTRSYSSEYVDAAADVLRRFLVPGAGRGVQRWTPTAGRARRSRRFKGHRMAKAALEMAVLDARAAGGRAGRSPATSAPSASTVPCGVSVGIMDSRRRAARRGAAATWTRATCGSS